MFRMRFNSQRCSLMYAFLSSRFIMAVFPYDKRSTYRPAQAGRTCPLHTRSGRPRCSIYGVIQVHSFLESMQFHRLGANGPPAVTLARPRYTLGAQVKTLIGIALHGFRSSHAVLSRWSRRLIGLHKIQLPDDAQQNAPNIHIRPRSAHDTKATHR